MLARIIYALESIILFLHILPTIIFIGFCAVIFWIFGISGMSFSRTYSFASVSVGIVLMLIVPMCGIGTASVLKMKSLIQAWRGYVLLVDKRDYLVCTIILIASDLTIAVIGYDICVLPIMLIGVALSIISLIDIIVISIMAY